MKIVASGTDVPSAAAHFSQVTNAVKPAPALVFTVITSTRPDRLTKIIGVDKSGKMTKESAANLIAGTSQRVQVSGLEQLRDVLDSLGSDKAVTWGVTEAEEVALCTERDDQAKAQGAIARSRENFSFPAGQPGAMMNDHDGVAPGMADLSPEEFRQRLIDAVPVLAQTLMLWRPSASAGCVRADGTVLTGLTKHRMYIPVRDASRIPAAGKALEILLWASGDGWCVVGDAGQALLRTIVDTAVWQPERLDFAGQPILTDGVTRPNCAGRIFGDEDELFDLERIIAMVTPEVVQRAEAAQAKARSDVSEERARVRAVWVAKHVQKFAQRRGRTLARASRTLNRASEQLVLDGSFELTGQDGSTVTVAELLADPEKYHDARFGDPLEPGEDLRVAVAKLTSGKPCIYSHQHGGVTYTLQGWEGFPEADQRPDYVVVDDWADDDGKRIKPGVYFCGMKPGKTGPELFEQWVCGPMHIDAITSDPQGNNFGRLLRFKNTLGQWREWAMPMEMLAGDGTQLRAELLGMGVLLDHSSAKIELPKLLQWKEPKRQMHCALQVGWFGGSFVLPDVVIGPDAGNVTFQSGEHAQASYSQGGTMEGWQQGIAAKAAGNPLLMLAVSASFVGPLLKRCNGESGGMHFVGDSSTGKTTLIEAACATWGGPKFMQSWRATANGLEGAAVMFNDSLMALDEINECDPRQVGEVVYMLGNGTGKRRASRNGTPRAVMRWSCFVMSSGERTIETAMESAGHQIKAGQTVRMLDVPAARKYGAWDAVDETTNPAAFSDAIKRTAAKHHGHAGMVFLEKLTRDATDYCARLDGIKALPGFTTGGTDGQGKRAAARFALIGMAGELAGEYGITGWKAGEAVKAAALAFNLWQSGRGKANAERGQILKAVAGFIERHGDSRFSDVDEYSRRDAPVVRDRAGWWEDVAGTRFYLFNPDGMREALKGFDFGRALDALQKAGALPEATANGERARSRRVEGRLMRLYQINPDFLARSDEA